MLSLLANVVNGTCPQNCKCTILFMDAIVQRTLKFVAFNGKDEPDKRKGCDGRRYPPYSSSLQKKAAELDLLEGEVRPTQL